MAKPLKVSRWQARCTLIVIWTGGIVLAMPMLITLKVKKSRNYFCSYHIFSGVWQKVIIIISANCTFQAFLNLIVMVNGLITQMRVKG